MLGESDKGGSVRTAQVTERTRDAFAFIRAVASFAGKRGTTAAALVAGGAVVEGFGVLMLVPLLGALVGEGQSRSQIAHWVESRAPGLDALQRLTLMLVLFGMVMIIRAIILWRRDVMLGDLQVAFVEAQRGSLARRLAAARWPALARLRHDRVTYAMGGDIQRCGIGVNYLFQSAAAAAVMFAQSIVAVFLAPALTVIAMTILALSALTMSGRIRRSHDVGLLVTNANLALTAGVGRFLGGMKMAKSQNLQAGFLAAFQADLDRGARWQSTFLAQQGIVRGLWSLLGAGVAAATLLFGTGLFHLPAPILLALLVLFARISGPASQIHNGLQQIAYSLPAWRAVQSLDRELANAAAGHLTASATISLPAGGIVFADVTYRHDASDGGVDRLSLHIDDGEIVGIGGASGTGKSTFADLLTGLLPPQSGHILIGGVALDDTNAAGWRDQIAYVAQDPVLFNQSIRENLAWANPRATATAMAEALAVVGADRLLVRLPSGLDTIVGESGALISGGERQRLALARALLRAPRLLILDEATSAIDLTGEHEILLRLRALAPRPTIVLIAHRGESLALCDRVLDFANGRVAAQRVVSAARDPAALPA